MKQRYGPQKRASARARRALEQSFVAVERRARLAQLAPAEKAARFAELQRQHDYRDHDEPHSRIRAARLTA